ncbi:biosynthetic-type acetolactate synthase large subunit [Anaerocolumna sp. MB42-C2]|uniref:biosynthetic-type acetolactate synthase large subunit n=1 Tax=Anaerocolumna sp. MB42-C2 TaxID=3070997 RepID=UPI0027E0BCFC|nr:biosynthetic-type acetolactate synthase large subunit [Anaerocolumna sp. MB42-C2]WMJ88766.1 biosynthetic-type acetolactate synthase large subunit [Anaerocolumna sp. MB42-C2]
MKVTGTELFVKALKEEGVTTLFGYPGGCVLDIFDELYKQNDIDIILPRHEQALIHAADGYARSTGNVGVCLVTSGPGATNLVTGIATANYDSVPLVCFTGQVQTYLIGNDAFQEVDIIGITRSICKYGVTVRRREDLGRIIKEAFFIASTGKPGPVVVDLPKDIMLELGSDSYPKEASIRSYKPNQNVHTGQIKKALEMIINSEKPVFLAGGGVTISRANKEFTKLAEITKVPVVTTIMGKGAIDTSHPLYIGNIGMHGSYAANQVINECDLLFSIGTRFNDRVTGMLEKFAPNAKIVHIDIDSASISKNVVVDIPIVADAKQAIKKMLEELSFLKDSRDSKFSAAGNRTSWLKQISEWKQDHPLRMADDKGLTPQKIINKINELFRTPIIVTDVGQNQMWTTQFLEMKEGTQLLTSGGLGTMGYGFPAAIGAKLGNMDKTVICISGDGGIQMNIQEMATAVAQELPLILCIFNNSCLGMVRQSQKLFYGKRYSSICLRSTKNCNKNCGGANKKCPVYSPDFIKLAKSYGAYGIRVENEKDIEPALLQAAKNTLAPTVIEFIIDSEELVLPMVQGGKPLNYMILDC